MIRFLLFMLAMAAGTAALWLYLQREPVTPSEPPANAVAPETPDAPEVTPEPELQNASVLAARVALVAGQQVSQNDLEWIDWPEEFVLSGFILRNDQPGAAATLNNRIATTDMAEGQPVLRNNFTEMATRSIAHNLAPGMRAVAVRVNVEAAAGGFVLPNDRVDVIHTYTPTGFARAMSSVVVSNVRVLALDQITQIDRDEAILVNRTATLELNQPGVEAVMAAQEAGTLTLALRSSADEAEVSLVPTPLSQTLATGMRAITIPDIEVAAGVFVRPNDRVDVVHSHLPTGAMQAASSIVVSNARVIAIDHITQPDSEQRVELSRTVTLELDRAGVEAISAARLSGNLTMTLRSEADQDEPPTATTPTVRIRRGGEN
ncbi:MAG: Flp pilus assembly protein CpaB [Pararhodobacter sp.]|nr:Flp pilus assembly protein CpaB [Pararhodobacter sp.]